MVSIANPYSLRTLDCTQLVDLQIGQKGTIQTIDGRDLKLALLQMGIGEGDLCTFTGVAPLRDPISIMVNRTKVTIRKRDAAHIWIKVI